VPQYKYITYNDNILINFVGKVENYNDCMKKLFPEYVDNSIMLLLIILRIKLFVTIYTFINIVCMY